MSAVAVHPSALEDITQNMSSTLSFASTSEVPDTPTPSTFSKPESANPSASASTVTSPKSSIFDDPVYASTSNSSVSSPSLLSPSSPSPVPSLNNDNSNNATNDSTQQTGGDDSILFVGDLARHVTDDDIRELFQDYGTIIAIDIKRDKYTLNNLGYGFVQYSTRDEANSAKSLLNGSELNGRKIRIGWAQKNTTLFIGDLDGQITSDQLKQIFSEYGPIVEEDTFVKSGSGKFGFVRFVTRSDAERAKISLNRKLIGSRVIRIGWGDNNIQKQCVHVQFNANDAENGNMLTENMLQQEFQRFGNVMTVSLPRSPVHNRRLKGYAFIHYGDNDEGEQSAHAAISTMADAYINGIPVRCSYGKRQIFPKNRRGSTGYSPVISPGGTSYLPDGSFGNDINLDGFEGARHPRRIRTLSQSSNSSTFSPLSAPTSPTVNLSYFSPNRLGQPVPVQSSQVHNMYTSSPYMYPANFYSSYNASPGLMAQNPYYTQDRRDSFGIPPHLVLDAAVLQHNVAQSVMSMPNNQFVPGYPYFLIQQQFMQQQQQQQQQQHQQQQQQYIPPQDQQDSQVFGETNSNIAGQPNAQIDQVEPVNRPAESA